MTVLQSMYRKSRSHSRVTNSLNNSVINTPTQESRMINSSQRPRQRGLLFVVSAVIAIAVVGTAVSFESPTEAARNTTANSHSASAIQFNEDGELLRPTGYRKWTYAGTPVTPNDMNAGKAPFPEFHSVYMNPDAYDHYQKTGDFPDGTVLVKELISVGTRKATSGNGYFMGEFIGLEVSVKDKSRFKDQPGYWAYFSFGHEYPLLDKAKVQPSASCNECHDGNADDDWVFTQYYPVLRSAKMHATK